MDMFLDEHLSINSHEDSLRIHLFPKRKQDKELHGIMNGTAKVPLKRFLNPPGLS